MVDSFPISFGRYTLVERLAMGGMAELFLATAPGEHGFQKKVVIKRLLPHLAREPVYTAMFIDEAKLTAALVHPKIAQTHELGRSDNDLFIAMEFVDGRTLREWLKEELARHPQLAVLGDLNVAPEDRDVHDPKAWEGQVLVSEPERAALRALVDLGLKDSFRLFEQPEKSFTWWDYRMLGFRRNAGLRIDHILLSPLLAARCAACSIDKAPRKLERPSDHTPVIAELR